MPTSSTQIFVAIALVGFAIMREITWGQAWRHILQENERLHHLILERSAAVALEPAKQSTHQRIQQLQLGRRLQASDAAPVACDANRTVAYVVAALHHKDGTNFVPAMAQALTGLHVLPAVNGFNVTETIEALLDSGLQFHNLSFMIRRWGKLATFLTKVRALRHQVVHGLPYQITLEDDIVLKPTFKYFVQHACERHQTIQPDVLILSPYSEVLLTSLAGAKEILRRLRQYGIRKNDDHQLAFAQTMGHRVGTYRPFLFKKGEVKPWKQGRKTNRGDIQSTSGMSWTEMALLRLITNPKARSLHAFGGLWNPPALRCCYCDPETRRS